MECPVSNHPDDIRDEKCKVLRCIQPVLEEQCLLGQYTAGEGACVSSVSVLTDSTQGSLSV
jgi:glucose-6-phosphate 1-dehydrogenase